MKKENDKVASPKCNDNLAAEAGLSVKSHHVLPGLQDEVIDKLEDVLERSEDDEDDGNGAGVPVG